MEITASIQDLIEGDKQLAALPAIFFQIKEVIEDPESSFFDVSEVISRDPALTCRLLRIVNSTFYGFPNQIVTISHAIGIIGLDQLSDLVLSTLVIDQFRETPDSVMNMRAFWEHNLACGLAARLIASYKNELNPERFFVAGLLHDIGQLAICLKAPEQALEAFNLSKSKDCLLHTAESEVLGFDHAAVGDALLRTWNLPEIHVETAAHHHKPGEANTHSLAASVIHIADIIAKALDKDIGHETFIPPLDEHALKASQVGESIFISTIMRGVVTRFEEAARVFL
ncbi:MAG: HDOD domain-containing protein [Nitrospinales bacterium]